MIINYLQEYSCFESLTIFQVFTKFRELLLKTFGKELATINSSKRLWFFLTKDYIRVAPIKDI